MFLSSGQATKDAMRLVMRRDSRVVLFGQDIRWGGPFGQFQGLFDEFGADRVIDLPISEGITIGACVGAAATGLRPVAVIGFVDFMLGAMDELVNHAAKFRYMFGGQVSVPMVVRSAYGTTLSGAAQHSQSLEALFAHIPGIKVVVPSTPEDAKGLLIAAIEDDDPVMYLENKRIQPYKAEVPELYYSTPLGKAAVRREGIDITIITYGIMARYAEEACRELEQTHQIQAELIDLRSLVPLDFETVARSVTKTRRAIVCHEDWLTGGFGAEVVARLSEELFETLAAPLARVAGRDVQIPFAPSLERAVVPGVKDVVDAALRTVTWARLSRVATGSSI